MKDEEEANKVSEEEEIETFSSQKEFNSDTYSSLDSDN